MRGALLFLKHSLLPTSYKPTRKNANRVAHGGSFEPFTLFQISRYGWWYVPSGGDMADHLQSSFAIIRFNSRTYESGGVMAVLQVHTAAENLMRDYEVGQCEEDRYNGWRYFLEETDLAPGMNAEDATKLRQVRLERRESGALTTPK
jgi:hypothetical protein